MSKTPTKNAYRNMQYYKYFDIVKLLFSFIIVSIHIKNGITNIYWTHITNIAVPMFFTLSALLFWEKINWNYENDFKVLKHYIIRLLILVTVWSLLLIPFWLPKFISQFPSQWCYYLLPKLLLYGGCRGGYFIMSLIYGTIILYVMHRYMNRHIVFIICLFMTAYYQFIVNQVFPDYLHIRHRGLIINTDFMAFRFLLYIELSIYIIPNLTRFVTEKRKLKYATALLFVTILTSFIRSAVVYFICSICFLSLFCSILCSIRCNRLSDFSITIRKMSIVIFLLHFIIIDYGESSFSSFIYTNRMICHAYSEYMVVLLLTVLIAYILVTIVAKKVKIIKYLY